MATYKYFADGDDDRYEVELDKAYDFNNPFHLTCLAKDMAKDYHYNHDGGWGDNYPFEITITHNDKDIATFYIEVEWIPAFSATSKNIYKP